ncbi:hypothetical protein BN1263180097 [Stenotrophomonas maltophilia]|nr:hypothetical protein BN1263180097 [Stenotrophomonas maltophilia]
MRGWHGGSHRARRHGPQSGKWRPWSARCVPTKVGTYRNRGRAVHLWVSTLVDTLLRREPVRHRLAGRSGSLC